MHTTKRRVYALVLGVCLLVSLAIGGVAAWAEGTAGWIEGNSSSSVVVGAGNNTLKVTIASNDAKYAVDLGKSNAVVDVYKVGSAGKIEGFNAYDYKLDADYDNKTNADLLDAAKKGERTADGRNAWEALADELAKTATLHEGGTVIVPTGTDGASVSGLADGIYLVLAHGSNITDGLKANSPAYTYNFTPIIVAFPNKDAVDEVRNTANPGEWISTLTVSLKSSRLTRYGAIEITKTVTDVSTEDSTFVFHITGTTPAGEEYDNYASVTIKAGELTGSVTVTHIPADTPVTVEEEYAAGRYNLGTVVVGDKGDVIIAENVIPFSCKNEPGGLTYGGHGVQNNYEYDKKNNGDWDWTPDRPEKATNYKE